MTVVDSGKEDSGSCEEKIPCTDDTFPYLVEPVLRNLPPDVTPNQRDRVVNFLRKFDDMFSRGTFDMGRTNLVEHTIDTGSHRPIRQPLRRHPRPHFHKLKTSF